MGFVLWYQKCAFYTSFCTTTTSRFRGCEDPRARRHEAMLLYRSCSNFARSTQFQTDDLTPVLVAATVQRYPGRCICPIFQLSASKRQRRYKRSAKKRMRIDLGDVATGLLRDRLIGRYANVPDAIIETPNGRDVRDQYKADIENHVSGRLNEFRDRQLKWVQKHTALNGCRVLEIGCGTGSSTAALGMAGAIVDGLDIDATALEVARLRCDLHGLSNNINLVELNATGLDRLNKKYELILFYATYQRMTHSERKNSLRKAWDLVCPGGLVGFIECPNRLWYFDTHTTFSNFYNWLPDDLAMDYAHFYERDIFRTEFEDGG